MFNRYYQSELTYLRELGMLFAKEHPDLTALFEDRGGDPDVDRLLEGFAFLTARLREQQDDAIPELVDPLAQLLLPHFARQVPAATIIELTPNPQIVRSRYLLEKGCEVAARPSKGTSCLFRSTRNIEMTSAVVSSVRLDSSAAKEPRLTLGFQTSEEGVAAVFAPGGVELFLHGQLPHASMLLLWFSRHLKTASYRSTSGEVQRLPAGCIGHPGLTGDVSLVPWPSFAPPGPQLLQTYLNLPESMLFVRIDGLEKIRADLRGAAFEIDFRFNDPPPLPERIEADQFRTNCVPVVNLFDIDADPIRRDPMVCEHLIRASETQPRHVDVYAVNKITAIRSNRGDRVQYPPLFGLAHSASDERTPCFYSTTRRHSPVDGGLDTYLSLSTPQDRTPIVDSETLAIELTCTNRAHPTNLHVGDVCVPTRNTPSVARFRNLVSVSIPVLPPIGSELHWRLISHLALNQRSLGTAETLTALLSLYNFHPPEQQRGRGNRNRIESIREVTVELVARMHNRAAIRGGHVQVTVDESRFSGAGDAFLLGCALDGLFAAQAPINSFSQLSLVLHPSGATIQWQPKNGQQSIL